MDVDRFKLEEAIMGVWSSKEDMELLFMDICDGEPTEDEIANGLIGLMRFHDLRMAKLWDIFTQMIGEGQFVKQVDKSE